MVTSVETDGLFDGPFTKLMKQMYIIASAKEFPEELHFPIEMIPYIRTLYKAFGSMWTVYDTKVLFKPYELDEHDTRCLCAFSGGRDSLANVIMLKQLGYEPTAFFVRGVNYKYGHEYPIAKALAERMGIPFIERRIIVHGKNEFPENPVKDQFILAMMLDFGLKQGIVNYSFGTYIGDPSDEVNKEYMLSDASDMFWFFEQFVNEFYPEVDMPMFLHSSAESLRVICDYDTDLLKYTCSCMSPVRFKQGYIESARKKYGVELLPYRCPSCYKCCMEAIHLNAYGVTQYPEAYLEHCKEVIYRWYAKNGTRSRDELDAIRLMDDYFKPSDYIMEGGAM